MYQAIVGCLAYLAQGTRPDLAFAVSTLGKFNSDPSEEHMIAAKWVLRYIRETRGAKLTFGGSGSGEELAVDGFVDADWAADRDNRWSTSGFVSTVAGGAVSWGSRKQGAVALSTAEAEYVAAGVAGREALLLSRTLAAAEKQSGTIRVNCDNQATIQLAKNPGSHHHQSKHIDIVHQWIRDKTQEGAFAFQYIPDTNRPEPGGRVHKSARADQAQAACTGNRNGIGAGGMDSRFRGRSDTVSGAERECDKR
ncbi:hypothetical protein A4X13_0g6606 [Tilletia indica]|uniref:Reverse transcriptase Ty1/copia-type domain-containing protein n=1 Tax=Tilletia indica TaxID=43049 RepID=A0A177TFB3_9BASI|nr:hypothetical protein A4X13_0g6606 [Tilletia indica]